MCGKLWFAFAMNRHLKHLLSCLDWNVVLAKTMRIGMKLVTFYWKSILLNSRDYDWEEAVVLVFETVKVKYSTRKFLLFMYATMCIGLNEISHDVNRNMRMSNINLRQ